jgi:serine/threonine protein phosphatase PrpC
MAHWLKELDLSQNLLGIGCNDVIRAAVGHPSLRVLQLEECNMQYSSIPLLSALISTSRVLRTLRVAPLSSPPEDFSELRTALIENRSLLNIDLGNELFRESELVIQRNTFVRSFADEIYLAPFQRSARASTETFFSGKGRLRSGSRSRLAPSLSEPELVKSPSHADRKWYGLAESIGRRSEMTNISIVSTELSSGVLFGVFDGHGGREAVESTAEHLPGEIKAKLESGLGYEEAFVESFAEIHRRVSKSCEFSGTTAAIAVTQGTVLLIAAVGDTRCVLSRDGKAIALTVDHLPDLPAERDFILSKGGTIEDGRINGVLALSRTIGDGVLGESANPTPDVRRIDLDDHDEFFILACHGVWGVMTNQEAVDLASNCSDPTIAARKIRDCAFERDSLDNISVVFVLLKPKEPQEEPC